MKPPLIYRFFTSEEPYETLYRLQKDLVAERIRDAIPDTLLLGEHDHVITLGRGTHPENLLNPAGVLVVEIERGGDVTYHGPGQLVGYPIIKLAENERDLHQYLRRLEEVLIRVLAHYGISGSRKPGWTGVWAGEGKVASIGVAVKKWVTYHGFALNVTTDLSHFQHINPCGLSSDVMTSLAQCLSASGRASPSIAAVQQQVIEAMGEVFGYQSLRLL